MNHTLKSIHTLRSNSRLDRPDIGCTTFLISHLLRSHMLSETDQLAQAQEVGLLPPPLDDTPKCGNNKK